MDTKGNGTSPAMEHGEHMKKDIPMDGSGMAESGVNVRTEPNNNTASTK